MNASIGKVPSWIFLVLVVTLASLHSSVAQFPWTKEPSSPIIVVEGVNNTNVRLDWGYDAAFRRLIVNIKIVRKGGGSDKEIARKSGEATINPTSLDLVNRSQDGREYEVVEPATLVLKDVNSDEEYEYIISVDYFPTYSSPQTTASKSVFVDVKVPPKITRKPLNTRSEIGANVTLTCEAAGDPLPNITWTREGATTNQLHNVTGPDFHLVTILLKDAGSYRCTAENGYGTVTTVASVSIICTSQCNTSTVGIRITEGAVWVDSLTNPNSAEFSGLANNLTAAISSPYSLPENEGKRPYEIKVNEFRPGSVRAFVDMEFPSNLSDPLKPLRDAMQDGKLGMFVVDPQREINATKSPIATQSSNESTQESKIPPNQGVVQFRWTKEPSSPIVVVEGVNNTNVRLEWDYNVAVRQLIVNVQIERKRNGTLKIIARKSGHATIYPTSLDLVDRNQDGREYEVVEPATLVLKEVNSVEEYEYVISVDYFPTSSSQLTTVSKSVFVDVKAPTESTEKSSTIAPNQGRRSSGLSNDVLWTIIGSCTTVVVIALSLL
ncbi:protein sax-3-like isoform X1 [Acropora millepora]|uniref:protein sax-3-like isoform X1 n=1 Tax=Acropora millepora TaxID=45264 RepID=UPI001CF3B37C|nr:protein sax-3-like isoform X1 [Acropora millepora]